MARNTPVSIYVVIDCWEGWRPRSRVFEIFSVLLSIKPFQRPRRNWQEHVHKSENSTVWFLSVSRALKFILIWSAESCEIWSCVYRVGSCFRNQILAFQCKHCILLHVCLSSKWRPGSRYFRGLYIQSKLRKSHKQASSYVLVLLTGDFTSFTRLRRIWIKRQSTEWMSMVHQMMLKNPLTCFIRR